MEVLTKVGLLLVVIEQLKLWDSWTLHALTPSGPI